MNITSITAALLDELTASVHADNRAAGWWHDLQTGRQLTVEEATPVKLALIHSEVSEALEAFRRDKADDHLPHLSGLSVELADVIIRVLDLAGAHGINLGSVLQQKYEYNGKRSDHRPENRKAGGGKKF